MSAKAAKLNTLTDLTPAAYNPREISDAAFAGLGRSLESFGDLSGIVWNAQTGRLVAGHQRVKALAESHGADLAISHAKNGEARSWIVAGGETFPIRVVDWNETTEKAANIAANSPEIAGTFTDGLGPLLDELRVSFDGFDDLRFEELVVEIPDIFGGEDGKGDGTQADLRLVVHVKPRVWLTMHEEIEKALSIVCDSYGMEVEFPNG